MSWELWKLWPGKILHPTHTEPSLRMEIALMKTTAREHKHHWQTKTRSHTRRPWDSFFGSDSTLSWWLFSSSLMVKCTVTLSVCLFKTVLVPNNTLNGASLDSNTHTIPEPHPELQPCYMCFVIVSEIWSCHVPQVQTFINRVTDRCLIKWNVSSFTWTHT